MRLIDADKLLERMKKGMESGSNLNGTFDLYIEHAPTVKPTGDLISRQDAIEAIAKRIYHIEDGNENDALRKAICDIDALPSVNAIPYDSTVTLNSPTIIKATSTDLISRQDALKPFCIAPDGTRIPEVDCDNLPVEFSVEFIKKHLLSLPSADRPTGEWILQDTSYWRETHAGPVQVNRVNLKCSNCGWKNHERKYYNYCPNCGAKMGGDIE